MRNYLILFLSFSLLMGCNEKNVEQDNRLYLKEIKVNNQRVVWFYYSLIGSTTADFVLLYDQNEKVDTIVKSTNIKDVNFSKNTVTLLFRGKPEIYDDPIILKKKVNGLNVKVDTTAVSTGPTFRKFYKRNNEGKLY